ncbi:hypothetical protein C8Q78DRAFT_507164 [Trametes maxima]|nr:hypothetical protein C8Q78DRAFT_507164 [Trametes maxima]
MVESGMQKYLATRAYEASPCARIPLGLLDAQIRTQPTCDYKTDVNTGCAKRTRALDGTPAHIIPIRKARLEGESTHECPSARAPKPLAGQCGASPTKRRHAAGSQCVFVCAHANLADVSVGCGSSRETLPRCGWGLLTLKRSTHGRMSRNGGSTRVRSGEEGTPDFICMHTASITGVYGYETSKLCQYLIIRMLVSRRLTVCPPGGENTRRCLRVAQQTRAARPTVPSGGRAHTYGEAENVVVLPPMLRSRSGDPGAEVHVGAVRRVGGRGTTTCMGAEDVSTGRGTPALRPGQCGLGECTIEHYIERWP